MAQRWFLGNCNLPQIPKDYNAYMGCVYKSDQVILRNFQKIIFKLRNPNSDLKFEEFRQDERVGPAGRVKRGRPFSTTATRKMTKTTDPVRRPQ